MGIPDPLRPLSPLPELVDLFCDRPPTPQPTPPFTGGQCIEFYWVIYRSVYRRGNTTEGFDETVELNRLIKGKIIGIESRFSGDASQNTLTKRDFLIFDSGNQEFQLQSYSIAGGFTGNTSIVSVRRADNQADECGDPPIIVLPPDPDYNDQDQPITYNIDNGDEITTNINFRFAIPVFNTDLDIVIPFTFAPVIAPRIRIGGNINITNGDINIGGGGGTSPSLPGGDKDSDKDNPDSFDTDNPVPPPSGNPPDVTPPATPTTPINSQTIIRGVIIKTLVLPFEHGVIAQANIQDIYYPRLGNVSFYVRVGQSYAWTTDIPVRSLQQIIECPWEGGAIDVKAQPSSGGAFEVTKVYRRGEKQFDYSLRG